MNLFKIDWSMPVLTECYCRQRGIVWTPLHHYAYHSQVLGESPGDALRIALMALPRR